MAHYQHPIKCLSCSLHFIVCSYDENWPPKDHPGDNLATCPECASDALLRWAPYKIDKEIFEVVPGPEHRAITQIGRAI